VPRLLIPPTLRALDTHAVTGGRHPLPRAHRRDAQFRTLLTYLSRLGGRPDLRAAYRADLEDLLLRRLWLTPLVDPHALGRRDGRGSREC